MDIGSLSITGRTRKNNQDSTLIKFYQLRVEEGTSEWLLCAVADGMGGLINGEMASRICIESIDREFANMEGTPDKFERKLSFALKEANSRIWRRGMDLKGAMGTTVSTALISREELIMANVGDSRIYILHADGTAFHTKDDSEAFSLLEKGEIGESDLRKNPSRNYLTKAIGIQQAVDVKIERFTLKKGDRILIASDGLWGALEEDQILKIVGSNASANSITETLVREANERDGSDNISCIFIQDLI